MSWRQAGSTSKYTEEELHADAHQKRNSNYVHVKGKRYRLQKRVRLSILWLRWYSPRLAYSSLTKGEMNATWVFVRLFSLSCTHWKIEVVYWHQRFF